MNFYFSWAEPDQQFCEKIHCRQDLEIIRLQMSQSEGEVAVVRLTVANGDQVKMHGWAYIAVTLASGVVPIFYGQVMSAPFQQGELVRCIELAARPRDVAQQLALILATVKEGEDWHPLFIEPERRDHAVEALEAMPYLFYWHPVTHRVSLSHYFNGNSCVDISQNVLQDTLKLNLADMPVAAVDVRLQAEWIQEAQGLVDLYPSIAAAFPQGIINTLTPTGLQKAWQRIGQHLRRSGYAVVHSALEVFKPAATGVLNLFPQTVHHNSRLFKRVWLKGKLLLAWEYRQRRREVVTFTIVHNNQVHTGRRPPKRLALNLQSLATYLPDKQASQFFTTAAGLSVINHAIKIAQCHLAASSRCLEVECHVPLPTALQLKLVDSVQIAHPSLPQGQVVGKLIGYRYEISFAKVDAWLRLAVATGEGDAVDNSVTRENLESPQVLEGVIDPHTLQAADFIEALEVQGTVEEQQASLDDGEALLPQTRIKLKLKDLRSHDVLESHYTLKDPLTWSAPQQTILTGE